MPNEYVMASAMLSILFLAISIGLAVTGWPDRMDHWEEKREKRRKLWQNMR